MSFVSFSFAILFTFTLAGRFLIGPTKVEKPYLVLLLIASLVFYGSFVPSYLLLLFFTTWVDFYAGKKIFESRSDRARKNYLILSIGVNLGFLAYFKYSGFILDGLGNLLGILGVDSSWVPHLKIVLPIGISFFTFQSMSYTIDIYRREIEPEQRYWRFLLFVSFFTHLVSGPIVRAKELIYQFDRRRKIRLGVWLQGLYLMIFGFFMKMVVADNLAVFVDQYWFRGGLVGMPAIVPWTMALLFSCQIFADFLGYSNIAMGAAYLLGFKLPLNFNNPYIARSFRDFWSRWHITLSRWIRDYLYISLGGNKGKGLRRFLVLMLTMVLAGLWHGASITFLVWGTLHGLALGLERALGMQKPEGHRPVFLDIAWFLTVQAIVLMGWVFFRADSTVQAFQFFKNMFGSPLEGTQILKIAPAFLFVCPVFLIHLRGFLEERGWVKSPSILEKAVWGACMFYFILTLYGKNNAFIYFQF
jgi:alginate O-acetyltransferase complex protein AlgI